MPMHVAAAVMHRKYRTEEEVRAMCAERGIPFESLIDLSVRRSGRSSWKDCRRARASECPRRASGERAETKSKPSVTRCCLRHDADNLRGAA
jgi:hypothetical protein